MSIFELLTRHKILFNNNFTGFKISESSIKLFDIDINKKLINKNHQDWNKFNNYFSFLKRIEGNILKLNHIGFGYKVEDVDKEINEYKKLLPTDYEIREEDSGDLENNRWFFIKHKTDKSILKIELVLYQTYKYKPFIPQFQIDIDTNMSFFELNNLTNEYISKDFSLWNYDIPNYGVVMFMGKIGEIDGVNIFLGLGTNLRKSPKLSKS